MAFLPIFVNLNRWITHYMTLCNTANTPKTKLLAKSKEKPIGRVVINCTVIVGNNYNVYTAARAGALRTSRTPHSIVVRNYVLVQKIKYLWILLVRAIGYVNKYSYLSTPIIFVRIAGIRTNSWRRLRWRSVQSGYFSPGSSRILTIRFLRWN